MATSGTYTYTLNTLQVIKDALIEAGVINDTEEVDNTMYDSALRRLNRNLKSLQIKGLLLWRVKEITLLLEDGKTSYTLGPSGDRCSETIVRTTLGAAEAAAQTELTVASSSGMTAADIVGIELDDGTVDWTTISSVDNSTTITVDDALTGAAASGNVVYAYTSLAPKPIRIHSAYVIKDDSENSHTPLNIIPFDEYFQRNDKLTESYPNDIYFHPELTTSQLKIWPLSDNNIARVVMMAELPLDDSTITTDDVAVPNWWYNAIHYRMAWGLAESYGAPADKVRRLRETAFIEEEEATNFSPEHTYIQLTPEYPGYNYG